MDAEACADMMPWLVFLVIDRRSGLSVAWAGGCAAACSMVLVAWAYWRGRRAPLARLSLVLFGLVFVAALASTQWDGDIRVSRSLSLLVLSAAAFASLRFTPLCEAYTTPLVAPGVQDLPRFRRVNTEMTLAWAIGSLLAGGSCASAAIVEHGGDLAFTFMDWVIPLLLAVATVLWVSRRWELFRLNLTLPESAGEHEIVILHSGNRDTEAGRGAGAAATVRGAGGAVVPLRRRHNA
jgi:hypothetical protein